MKSDQTFFHGDLDALASDRSRRGTVMGVRTGEPDDRVLMDGNVLRTHDTSQFVRADNSKTGRMRQNQLDTAEPDFARRTAELDAAARADIFATPVVCGGIHITRQAPNP